LLLGSSEDFAIGRIIEQRKNEKAKAIEVELDAL
jgi:hypothetical protein